MKNLVSRVRVAASLGWLASAWSASATPEQVGARVVRDGHRTRHPRSVRLLSAATLFLLLCGLLPGRLPTASTPRADASAASTAARQGAQIQLPGSGCVVVNTYDGNVFCQIPLFGSQANGGGLDTALSYNSNWRLHGSAYGMGWQLAPQLFYRRTDDGDIVVAWGDGRTERYTRQAGRFSPPDDSSGSLVEQSPGKYVLRAKDGFAYFFDSPVHQSVSRIVDSNDRSVVFSYDDDMRVSSISDYTGRVIRFSYVAGHLASVADETVLPGRAIRLVHDANGHLSEVRDALGHSTTFEYDADHRLKVVTPPSGASTRLSYDEGTVRQLSDGVVTKTFTFSGSPRTTEVLEEPPGRTTRFSYDAVGQIRSVRGPLGDEVQFEWDSAGNLSEYQDALGRITRYTYDTLHNITSVIDPLGNRSDYTYEPRSNKIASIRHADGSVTTYDYDDRGNLVKHTDPANRSTMYTIDAFGQTTARTDPEGITTTYTHDARGNLLKSAATDGTFSDYAYDDIGRMTAMSNGAVTVRYAYDLLDRPIRVDYPTLGHAVTYSYTASGNRAAMHTTFAGTTSYAYDQFGRVAKITNHAGESTAFSYDDAGRLKERTLHNGVRATLGYDAADQVVSLEAVSPSGAALFSQRLAYDVVGNLQSIADGEGRTSRFSYDAADRLVEERHSDGQFTAYTYDAVGNRIASRDHRVATGYSYDASGQLVAAGARSFLWDDNGNMLQRSSNAGTTTYTYDAENRLTVAADSTGATWSFLYYPDGRRLAKQPAGGQGTYYVYDGPNVAAELTSSGAVVARFTSGVSVDDWISVDRGGTSTYLLGDALGSIVAELDSAGTTLERRRYDVFGAPAGDVAGWGALGLAGRELDETGLYYFRARYYDPVLGRFLTRDPFMGEIGDPLSHNGYAFARNSPTTYVDPFGYWSWKKFTRVVSKVVGAAYATYKAVKAWQAVGFWCQLGPIACAISIGTAALATYSAYDRWQEVGKVLGGSGPPSSGGTSTGATGGVESHALKVNPSSLIAPMEAPSAPLREEASTRPTFELWDVMPSNGPRGSTAVPITPPEPLRGTTNAEAAAAVDFRDPTTSRIHATVFLTKTGARAYEHDYSVCGRFKGYRLESAAPVPVSGLTPGTEPWFWHLSMTKGSFTEETFIFAAFFDETRRVITVDSRWLGDQYRPASAAGYDYAFNAQVWAADATEGLSLLRRTLANMAGLRAGWTMEFANTAEPRAPPLIIETAELVGRTAKVAVRTWFDEERTVRLHGSARPTYDRASNTPFSRDVVLQPGFNRVEVDVGDVVDAVIELGEADFVDRVYVGSGFWFAFDDSATGSSHAEIEVGDCGPGRTMIARDLTLVGCVELTGRVGPGGWVGVGRTLNPNGRPIDVSQYAALSFVARGDGKPYRVIIETASVRDAGSTDFHQYVFLAPPQERQFVTPLALFTQQGWDRGALRPLTLHDVKAIAWTSVGAPVPDVALSVDRVAFTNSLIITETTVVGDAVESLGPFGISARIGDDVGVASARLLYSIDGGTFVPHLMTRGEDGLFRASIPRQDMGAHVRYYVAAADEEGNVATDPPGAPDRSYGFEVSRHLDFLIDDFPDRDPANALGKAPFTFGVESGGEVAATLDGEALRLDYDVSRLGSFSGYSSPIGRRVALAGRVLVFRIRGAEGKERLRIGLRDASGSETKVLVDQHLKGGITRSWQPVAIPLAVLAEGTGSVDLESLVVVFENTTGSDRGQVTIDDLRIEHRPDASLVVDTFDGTTRENALGGGRWEAAGGGATIAGSYEHDGAGGAVYRIDYAVPPTGGWVAAGSDLRRLDVSALATLSFAVRGLRGGESPHIYLISGADPSSRRYVALRQYAQVTTAWQTVRIPLTDFAAQGVDLSHLRYLEFVLEWTPTSGTILLDDVRFEPGVAGPTPEPSTDPPPPGTPAQGGGGGGGGAPTQPPPPGQQPSPGKPVTSPLTPTALPVTSPTPSGPGPTQVVSIPGGYGRVSVPAEADGRPLRVDVQLATTPAAPSTDLVPLLSVEVSLFGADGSPVATITHDASIELEYGRLPVRGDGAGLVIVNEGRGESLPTSVDRLRKTASARTRHLGRFTLAQAVVGVRLHLPVVSR